MVDEFARGTACFLYPTPNAGTSRASQAFWAVDDVDALIGRLKDSEGNIMVLVRRL